MLSLNGREVTLARIQTVTHIKGIGQMGPALDRDSASKSGLGSMRMYKVEDGLYLKGGNWEAFIPNGNIISMQFAPEVAS